MTGIQIAIALAAGYVAVLVVLACALHPLRVGMFMIAKELLAEPQWEEHEREDVRRLLGTSFSFRVGLVLPAAFVGSAMDTLLGRDTAFPREYQRLGNDPRYHKIVERYFASVLAANPLVAPVTIVLMVGDWLLDVLKGERRLRQSLEEPVRRASESMAHCY